MNKQNVVVTGAGGTLCSVIAVDFAKQGHNVVLVGRSLDKLQKVEEEIKAFGIETLKLEWLGCERSPLLGPEGNVEFLAWWRTPNEKETV